MPKLPVCKGKEAVEAFEKHGWSLARYIDDQDISMTILFLRNQQKTCPVKFLF